MSFPRKNMKKYGKLSTSTQVAPNGSLPTPNASKEEERSPAGAARRSPDAIRQ